MHHPALSTIRRMTWPALATVLFAAGCGGPLPGEDADPVDTTSAAISNGAVTQIRTIVKVVLGGNFTCTATVVNANWALTSAHCFVGGWDANGDGFIMGTEIVSPVNVVTDWDDANPRRILAVAKPQATLWGPFATLDDDIAMVFLDGQPGTNAMLPVFHGNGSVVTGTLNLYNGPYSAIRNTTILTYGYGRNSGSAGSGTLRLGYLAADIPVPNGIAFMAKPFLGWTACKGDSGGPSFAQLPGSSIFVQVGIVKGGSDETCNGTNNTKETFIPPFRDWIISTAAWCPFHTPTGPCSFRF
jgi:hypothetical protein